MSFGAEGCSGAVVRGEFEQLHDVTVPQSFAQSVNGWRDLFQRREISHLSDSIHLLNAGSIGQMQGCASIPGLPPSEVHRTTALLSPIAVRDSLAAIHGGLGWSSD